MLNYEPDNKWNSSNIAKILSRHTSTQEDLALPLLEQQGTQA
jgi:hypothetical protein